MFDEIYQLLSRGMIEVPVYTAKFSFRIIYCYGPLNTHVSHSVNETHVPDFERSIKFSIPKVDEQLKSSKNIKAEQKPDINENDLGSEPDKHVISHWHTKLEETETTMIVFVNLIFLEDDEGSSRISVLSFTWLILALA